MNDISARYLELIEELIKNKYIKDSKELSLTIGVSVSSMTEINKGRTNVGLSIIQKTVSHFPEINLNWLIKGDGNIFNTKSTESVTNKKCNIDSNILGNKRKVQKTSSNDTPAFYPPIEPSPSILNDSGNDESSTSQSNYLSEMSDDEVDELLGDQFEEALLSMIEEGRVYPAFMMEAKDAKILELQREIWELQNKLSATVPQSTPDTRTVPVRRNKAPK